MTQRPITIDDLYHITMIEDPRISPDGQWVAYIQATIDRLDNDYKRNIWLVPSTGGDPIQLTRSGKDSQPRWSPDGRWLAFVSGREKKPQIYLLRITAPGGEARQITTLPNGASSPAWSPDSQRLAFLSSLNEQERAQTGTETAPPQDKLEARHRAERKEQTETERWDPREVWRIPYRTGTSYLDDRYAQVHVIDIAEGSQPRRLTDLNASYGPPQWAADGQHLLTSRSTTPDEDQPGRNSSLFRIHVDSGTEEILTDDDFTAGSPLPSPDGKWIAYTRLPKGDHYNERIDRLALMPAAGGESRDLNMDIDRSVGAFRWAADSSALFFSTSGDGVTTIHRAVPAGGDSVPVVTGLYDIETFDVSPAQEIAFAAATPANPSELYWQAEGVAVTRTQVNQAFLAQVSVQEIHEIRYTSPDGQAIQGWYILPPGYQDGQAYPLAVNIHGGPHVMWGAPTQSIWHENQSYAARGYVVFYCNPRGAAGYGEAFQMALHANWGDLAYGDIMAGVDAMIAKGMVDTTRMAVTGGSYGGYMTAWIVGHTDRFIAAVSQRGVYNLLGFFGTTDIPLFLKDEFGLLPWENPMELWEKSPLAHAHKIKTPLLIIHSENDYRVPISEGEQLFAYIKLKGGTVKLVRFPRDGHELSRSGEPAHRAKRLNYIIDWFDTYCKPQ